MSAVGQLLNDITLDLNHVKWDSVVPIITVGAFVWRGMLSVTKRVRSVVNKLDTVANQLQPNGGSSIRDSVDRIEKTVRTVEHATLISNARAKLMYEGDFDRRGYFEADEHGDYTYVSNKWCTMHNMEWENSKNSNWINAFKFADQQDILTKWRTVVSEGRDFDAIYTISDGRKLHAHARPVKTDEGTVIRYLGWVVETD